MFLRQKKKRSVIFSSFGTSCWNCIFKRPRWRAFKRRTACRFLAKKSCSSHLFGVVPSPYAQTAFAPELSKAITFFCLRFYPGEISYSNSPNWELSNDFSDVVVRRRKVALHTSSHLTPTEAWRSPDSTTWEGRRVSSEVRLGNCTQIWGVGQIWRAWDSRLRKNSTSHLFWLVQTCPELRTIQWPCTLVSQCHFFALSNALILRSYALSWWNCIF